MIQVHRSGSIVSIPKKLSHHVPRIPILESQDYDRKVNMNFHDINSEEFQLYKTASVEEYNLHSSVDFEIVGKCTTKNKNNPELDKAVKFMNGKQTEGDLSRLRTQLVSKAREEMEEMLPRDGPDDDMFSQLDDDEGKEKLRTVAKKGSGSSTENFVDILKSSGMSEQGKEIRKKSTEEVEEMLRSGHSLSDVIRHFLTPNTAGVEGERTDKLEALLSNMNQKEKEILEDCLKSGKGLEETIELLGSSRRDSSGDLNISAVLNDTSLSIEEKFCLLKGNMAESEVNDIKDLVRKGYTVEEALKAVAAEEDEASDFKKKIKSLMKGKNLGPKEVLELIKEYLSEEELKVCEDMTRNKYRIDDMIEYFLKYGKGRQVTDFENMMVRMLEGRGLSDDEKLELLKSQLGPESLLEIEELLSSGVLTKSEIIKMMIRKGKTREMEECFTKLKLANLLSDPNISIEEKVNLVKEQLSRESRFALEELVKQGYGQEEVLELFVRCANNLTNINNDKIFKKTVRFSDEPPDAFLYEARNVWSILDKVEVKLNIPYMNNNNKCTTFTCFFGKIVKLTTGQGLTHREILDLIRFRLGGSYAEEFDWLRSTGCRLQEIVDYFLLKDEAQRQESLRRARLRAQVRIEKEVRLARPSSRTDWGVTLLYSISLQAGLHLIVERVEVLGPAYRSGLRPGDMIAKVDDWLITLMDRPQVDDMLD